MSSYANWTIEDDEVLINYVRNHEPLYNTKCRDYRKSQMKQNLWREIGEVLNKTDFDCSKRWCYIRDYYIRRRGKPCASGEAAKKRAAQLSFLDNIRSNQRNNTRHDGQDETPKDHETPKDGSEISENSLNNSEQIFPLQYENVKIENSHSDETLSEDSNTQEIDDSMMSINKDDRKHKNAQTQEFANQDTQNELDENDLFFGSMAKIMKKLPLYEQVQLRMQIGTLVGTAELRHIPKNLP